MKSSLHSIANSSRPTFYCQCVHAPITKEPSGLVRTDGPRTNGFDVGFMASWSQVFKESVSLRMSRSVVSYVGVSGRAAGSDIAATRKTDKTPASNKTPCIKANKQLMKR